MQGIPRCIRQVRVAAAHRLGSANTATRAPPDETLSAAARQFWSGSAAVHVVSNEVRGLYLRRLKKKREVLKVVLSGGAYVRLAELRLHVVLHDADIARLAACDLPALAELHLRCDVTQRGIRALAGADLPSLSALTFTSSAFNVDAEQADNALVHWRWASTLQRLEFTGHGGRCSLFVREMLAHCQWSSLHTLAICDNELDEDDASHLSMLALPSLYRLLLCNTDAVFSVPLLLSGAVWWIGLRELTWAHTAAWGVTLYRCFPPALEVLNLSNTNVSDGCLEDLAAMRRQGLLAVLRKLDVSGSPGITLSGLHHMLLQPWPALHTLRIRTVDPCAHARLRNPAVLRFAFPALRVLHLA